jgi:hypothetical protein
VVKQAVSAKVGDGHTKLSSALVVAHEVVFVVTGEDTSETESNSGLLIKFGVHEVLKVRVSEVVERSEPVEGFHILVSPLGILKGFLKVVGVKGDGSCVEVGEVAGSLFPVVRSEQVLVFSHLECYERTSGTAKSYNILFKLRFREGLVVEVVVDNVSDSGFSTLTEVLEVGGVKHVVVDESDLSVVALEGDHFIPEEEVVNVDFAVLNDVKVNLSLHVEISLVAVHNRGPLLAVLHGEEVSKTEGANNAVHVA